MSEIKNRILKTNFEGIEEILEFQLNEKINEHATCILKAMISETSKDAILERVNKNEKVSVFIEEITSGGENKIAIFQGLIKTMSIYQEGDLFQIQLELVSASFLMDMERKCCSYQNKDMKYCDLIQGITKGYDGGDSMDSISDGAALNQLVVQYEETDWAFMKRLASHFDSVIFPSTQFAVPKIYFGRRKYLDEGELESYAYEIKRNLETDARYYQVNSNNYYELSAGVMFQGDKLYISACEGKLIAGELKFTYTLTAANGMSAARLYPEQLCGVSLEGTVLKVVGNKIKVHLSIDDKQDEETAWEFPYQTMYSAAGQGGWYCMPEQNEKVFIYFPDKEESKAVGVSSSREGKSSDEQTEEPTIKYFRTIYGKEIRFTPEEVVITCINETDRKTGEEKKVRIILHQGNGITLETSENITFNSDKSISIEAEETVSLYAGEQIELHCQKGMIKMDSMIDIAAPDVRIN